MKKVLSVLLVLCMLLSSFTAMAVEDNIVTVYSDDFGSGTVAWTKSNSKYFSAVTGKLVYKNVTGSSFTDSIENTGIDFSNGYFDFELTANNVKDFAVKVRAKEKDALLIFFDYTSKKIRLSKTIAGGKNVLIKESDFVFVDKKKYDVSIELAGDEIIIRIDGVEQLKAVETTLKSGYIGFSAKKGQFEIDNIRIYKDSEKIYTESAVVEKTTKIYVAPDGSDETGDGTYDKPFATMAKARDMTVRAMANYLPVEVIFKEGTYKIDKVTSFTSANSGSATSPVTYKGEDGKEVVFTGATVIDHTKFEPIKDGEMKDKLYDHVKDKVYQLDLSAQGFKREDLDFVSVLDEIPTAGDRYHDGNLPTVNFFLNDRKQQISRWPNSGFALIERGVQGSVDKADPYTGGRIFFSNPEPLRWTNAKDAYVEGLLFYEWYSESIPIKEINTTDMSIDLARYSVYGIREQHEYCVKNLLEEVDRPGEWYVDFDTMILYYYPEKKLEAEDVFEVSTLKQAFVSLNGASHLAFKNITFKNSLGLIHTLYDAQGNYIDFGRYHAKNQFEDFGGGIEFGNYSHDIVIDGCKFKDINGTGVRSIGYQGYQSFWEDMNIYIQNCDFYRCSNAGVRVGAGSADVLKQGNFNINNCFFYENGITTANSGVCGYEIANNLLVRIFDNAIRTAGNEYSVVNNEIQYGAYGMSDMGAIYAGRNTTEHGSVMARNLLMNYGPAPVEARSFPCGGIYLDDTVGGISLYQNMAMGRSKNYQSTGLIYGGGPDVKYVGNISLDAKRGFVIQNRAGASVSYLQAALNPTKSRLENGGDVWLKKYPEIERMKAWIEDPYTYDAQVQIYDNLSTNSDVALLRTNFDTKPYLTGRVDDAFEINDLSIYVDPENYDYRLTMEAVKKYNLPQTLPNEENLDINDIGLTRELKYNNNLVDFEITYPENGDTVDYANKVGLSWQHSDAATIYEYKIASDNEFKNIVAEGKTMDNYTEITSLDANSTYYVKIKAVSESRKGYEVYNKNGVIEFKTPSVYYSNTALLEEAVKALEDEMAQTAEGTEAGQAKVGTKAKALAVINSAMKVVNEKPAQSVVDNKTAEVADFTKKIDAFKNTGYATVKITKKSVWNSKVPLKSIEITDGTTVMEADKETTVTLEKILPNTEVLKFKYEISSLDSWHAWGLRIQDSNKYIYENDCYYVLVKKDIFELQKKGKILATAENNGIIEAGKTYDITLGAVTLESGVNLYAEVNGKVLFDYLDTDDTKDLPGMFAVYVPGGATLKVSQADNIPAGLFAPSQAIIEASTLGAKTVFDSKSENFEYNKEFFVSNNYNRNPEGATEYESTQKGAQARWNMVAKGDTTYEVYYFHHGAPGNDNAVEITLSGKDGTYKTIVDMSKGGEEYRLIGTFKFVSNDAKIGLTSIVFTGSGNGKLPVSSVYIREVSNDNPDMLKPENQQ